jgi:predicted GNAT superfamily acetyltransferase
VVAAQTRGSGIGRLLIQEVFRVALGLGVEKLTAQMTADQRGALTGREHGLPR